MFALSTNRILCSTLFFFSATVHAQFHGHHHGAAADAGQPARAPYAAMHIRSIKALSAQQTADLRAGKGMALALPAELNGYPGPAHVLELAAELGLSEEQKRSTQALFAQMQAEAQSIGEAVIASEEALDRLFREKKANAETIQQATADAAQVHGRLRAAHLRSHVQMLKLLTAAQVDAYRKLRGYDTVSMQIPEPVR